MADYWMGAAGNATSTNAPPRIQETDRLRDEVARLEAENARLRNVADAARVLIGLKTRLWQGPLGCWYCGHADTEGHDDRCEWALLRAALAGPEEEASGG